MVISKTPLRISFVGGGTDFEGFYTRHQGQVISSAIDKYVYVVVKERFDDRIVLHYTENEIVESVSAIKHELIREALKCAGINRGIEIITLADITSKGSGLGSSSVLTVGLLNALFTFRGEQRTNEDLARIACDIELEQLKKSMGKQDQYIAAYGGLKKLVFCADGNVHVKNIPLTDQERLHLGHNLLLHFTRTTRKAEGILEEQKKNIDTHLSELRQISGLVDRLEVAFEHRDFDALGHLLKENWMLKKGLASRISHDDIDIMVNLAYDNGALGCKIAGAGGGGFLLGYVPMDKQDRYRSAMAGYRELPFMLDPFGSRIILNLRGPSNNPAMYLDNP